MTALVDSIFTSIGVVAAFVLTAGWMAARPQSRAARRTAVGVALAYVVASVFAVPQTVGWLLFTHRFHVFETTDAPAGRTAIVLLGGGTDTSHGIGDTTLAVASGDGLERVLEAVRVFNMTHAEWLISSGGRLDDRQERDAIVMRDELVQMGIPAARIVLEAASQTTHEQAVLVAPMLKSLGAERVILVTSDVHMPRALGAFRAFGVTAVPAVAPATHARDTLFERLTPTQLGLWRSQQVAHEMFGIVYYSLRGWWR